MDCRAYPHGTSAAIWNFSGLILGLCFGRKVAKACCPTPPSETWRRSFSWVFLCPYSSVEMNFKQPEVHFCLIPNRKHQEWKSFLVADSLFLYPAQVKKLAHFISIYRYVLFCFRLTFQSNFTLIQQGAFCLCFFLILKQTVGISIARYIGWHWALRVTTLSPVWSFRLIPQALPSQLI